MSINHFLEHICVIDENGLSRKGLSSILSEQFDVSNIREEKSLAEVCNVIDQKKVSLLFLSLYQLDDKELSNHLSFLTKKNIPVVLLISSELFVSLPEILKIPCQGVITANEVVDLNLLSNSLEDIAGGKMYYSPVVTNYIIQQFSKEKHGVPTHGPHITERELDIIRLVAKGLSSKQISDRLFISVRTVDTHRHRIMKKLHVKNSIELIDKCKKIRLLN